MEYAGRNYLTGSILLSRHEDGSSPERYDVSGVVGEGGTAVCYEATRTLSNGVVESGKLKEYYPVDAAFGSQSGEGIYYSMRRLPDGQLIPGAGTVRKFEDMCADYLDTYRMLKQVVAENPDNEILKSYIQHGEILYGVLSQEDRKKMGEETPWDIRKPTVYIWSSGVAGKGFDEWLAEVRESPEQRPEENLRTILSVMSSVTDCIKAMHTAGLMHLDIKPANFLVQYDSDRKIRQDSVSLFDVSSLRSVDSRFTYLTGTRGFMAPEVKKGKPDNRSDIYSIGAVLFYALVISPNVPDGLYNDAYYGSIRHLLKASSLIQASVTCQDSSLLSRLCTILEKCLAKDREERYGSCSELKEDLEAAMNRLDTVLLTPLPKAPEEGVADPTLAIGKLLTEHPLFETAREGQTDLYVLLLGAGDYGQRFMDLCLQAGQMIGTRLHLVAVSDKPEQDKEDYLKFRPAIPEFVNVDDGLPEGTDSYADLQFRSLPEEGASSAPARFSRNTAENRNLILHLLTEAEEKGIHYDYIFVSLGSDQISRAVAGTCAQVIREQTRRSCPVCYVTWETAASQAEDRDMLLYPVNISEPVRFETIDRALGEMVFNTHIVWDHNMNMDVRAVRIRIFTGQTAEDRYNRNASLAYVLSIPYKLHSVGIDPADLRRAAAQFADEILGKRETDPEVRKLYDALVDLEHRRWIMQMAADGWTAPRRQDGSLELESCISRGQVKDTVNLRHPCMVRGSASSPLSGPDYRANRHEKWDVGPIDPQLDELDTMSLSLHRVFRKETERLKKENLGMFSDLEEIETEIPASDEKAVRAFRQYRFALENILAGVQSYARQYGTYQDNLLEAAAGLSETARTRISDRLKILRHMFFPVIESCLYRDYKTNDNELIDSLPFIATYRYAKSLALAFSDGRFENGRNESVFPDVASATVLGPERIFYLYCIDQDTDPALLESKLEAVLNYLSGRKVRCRVEFTAACLAGVPEAARTELKEGFDRLQEKYKEGRQNAYLTDSVLMEAGSYAEAAGILADAVTGAGVALYDVAGKLFPSTLDNAAFDTDMIRRMPCFEFDWRNKRFIHYEGCDYLRYVRDSSFMRIRDMFGLMNAEDTRYTAPDLTDDLKPLWQIYTGEYPTHRFTFDNAVGNWNRLCGCLADYENRRRPLVSFQIDRGISSDPDDYENWTYFLRSDYRAAVRKLLFELKKNGIIGEESRSWMRSGDSMAIEIRALKKYRSGLEMLFEDEHMMQLSSGFDVVYLVSYNYDTVEVRCDSMRVESADLNPEGRWDPKYSCIILSQLQDAHMIRNLTRDANDPALVSFSYVSPAIKKVLTQAGAILEIYAYYDVLKTGYFDDIATGYEFRWSEGDVKNELDLVLTKGFRSMIVECKAVKQLEMNYYLKLHSIASQFGIGTVSVLAGNTYQSQNAVARHINTLERSRGSQLHIRTVYGEEKIRNIGETLKKIMEEGFHAAQ